MEPPPLKALPLTGVMSWLQLLIVVLLTVMRAVWLLSPKISRIPEVIPPPLKCRPKSRVSGLARIKVPPLMKSWLIVTPSTMSWVRVPLEKKTS